jgi:hypothetical protein
MKPKYIKHLQRQGKKLHVSQIDKNTFVVESVSNPLASHIVTVHFDREGKVRARCTCPWAINRGVACSHVIAALEYLASRKGRSLSFWRTEREAKRQRHRCFYLAGNDHDEGVWITSRAA